MYWIGQYHHSSNLYDLKFALATKYWFNAKWLTTKVKTSNFDRVRSIKASPRTSYGFILIVE